MTVAAEAGATTTTTEGQQQAPATTEQQQPTTAATQEQPATPPAPAPEVIGEQTPAAAPEGNGISYQETGDVSLDLALEFIASKGIGPDHPAIADAAQGKFDKLEAHLAALGEDAKGYERYLSLAKDAYQRSADKAAATQTAITAAVHEVAGDDKTWTAVKDWAGKNADPAEKEAINAMLSAGPVQARAAALMLTQLYQGAGGTVVTPASVTLDPAGGPSPTSNGALSPAEYASAVRELRGQLGSRMDDSQEYSALRARRAAWRG